VSQPADLRLRVVNMVRSFRLEGAWSSLGNERSCR
jgi:hypothetical protein